MLDGPRSRIVAADTRTSRFRLSPFLSILLTERRLGRYFNRALAIASSVRARESRPLNLPTAKNSGDRNATIRNPLHPLGHSRDQRDDRFRPGWKAQDQGDPQEGVLICGRQSD